MKKLILSKDSFLMNWIEGNTEWGTVKCNVMLDVDTKSERDGDIIKESYIFTNNTNKDIFTSLTDISIYTPFNDNYSTAAECMTSKCHAHIWCGGDISYVMALRMGGKVPHLGLVLNSGSLGGYSIERDIKEMSNDRGDFIMHPTPFSLAPGESYTISWTLFPHNGKDDFRKQAVKYCSKFINVHAEKYILFQGETSKLEIEPAFDFSKEDVRVEFNGIETDFIVSSNKANKIEVNIPSSKVEEIKCDITVKGVKTYARILVLPEFNELLKRRCEFIALKQQYNHLGSHLDGAYLIYDNEENSLFYSPENDYNGGRERVGMGILLARYLQKNHNSLVEQSLCKYEKYVSRELVDKESGEVFNDYMRDNSYKRLYNAPWFALFYIELYQLYKNQDFILTAYKIIHYYYENDGVRFYPIALPVCELIANLKKEGLEQEIQTLKKYFIQHADYIADTGTDYPVSEVNYEQSIVAPAADILFQVYEVTGDKKYLDAGKKQLEVLELFHSSQPDYHQNEVSIRHWDGYWFGKTRMYGDTYPHYWSALNGIVYKEYAKITKNETYNKKAEMSLRGVLSMFRADGLASCAYLYPVSVNGQKGNYADAYANDQDWGLYFALKG